MRFRFFKLVFLILFVVSFQHLTAQTSDMKLYELFNKQDYWELNKQYPLLKKQASEFYQLFTEAYLDNFFNRPEQSNEKIKQLFDKYKDRLVIENQIVFNIMYAINLVYMQNYTEAASIFANLAEKLENQTDSASLAGYKNAYKQYASLENVAPMSVTYGKKQTNIPLGKDTLGYLTLPISIGKEKSTTLNFTIDFGANFCMIEERFVNGLNIRILSDSILFHGAYGASAYGKIGVADEIYLGDILVKNVIFYIAPNRIIENYPENEMNAILGLPVLKALENLQISNSNFLISPVSKPSKHLPNMLISNLNVFIHAQLPKNSLTLLFDSGSKQSTLAKNYLSKNQIDISSFVADTVHRTGYGGGHEIEVLKMPNFSFKIGNKKLHFPLMDIEMTDVISSNVPIDGVLGVDVLSQSKKIIFDFKNMYFQVK